MAATFQNQISWLQTQAAPYLPDVQAALLERVSRNPNGQARPGKVQDIVLIGPEVERPTILNLQHETGARFDVAIHDPATLTWGFEHARRRGRGVLLRRASHSLVLGDQPAGQKVQEFARQIQAAGPQAVTKASLEEGVEQLRADAKLIAQSCDPHVRAVAAAIHGEQVGHTSLRSARAWSGRGKVLAHALHAAQPEFKGQLDEACGDLAAGDAKPMLQLIEQIPARHVEGADAVPLRDEPAFPRQPHSAAEAYFYASQNSRAVTAYRQGFYPQAATAANQWLGHRYQTARRAVDPARFNRPHGEYAYALASYWGVLADLNLYTQQSEPRNVPLANSCGLLLFQRPHLRATLKEAVQGRPHEMLAWGDQLAYETIGRQTVSDVKVGPAFCRQTAAFKL